MSIVIDENIELDGTGVFLKVRLDSTTFTKYNDFSDSLMASRDIEPQVTSMHPHVILLSSYAKDNGDIETSNPKAEVELIEDLIHIVQREHDRFEREVRGMAFVLALLDSNFTAKKATLKAEEIEVTIPPEYWDKTEQNGERMYHYLPPLPKLNKFHPAEKRIATIVFLSETYPEFGQQIQIMASKLFNNILAEALKGDADVDDSGFQPESLD